VERQGYDNDNLIQDDELSDSMDLFFTHAWGLLRWTWVENGGREIAFGRFAHSFNF
jgi:hypothetical protein